MSPNAVPPCSCPASKSLVVGAKGGKSVRYFDVEGRARRLKSGILGAAVSR